MNGHESFHLSPEARRKYETILQQYLETLQQAVEEFDLETVGMVAHKIQGNAGLFGHPDLGLIARDLRAAGLETNLPVIQQLLVSLRDYFVQHVQEPVPAVGATILPLNPAMRQSRTGS